jgi:hypothetical protein
MAITWDPNPSQRCIEATTLEPVVKMVGSGLPCLPGRGARYSQRLVVPFPAQDALKNPGPGGGLVYVTWFLIVLSCQKIDT